MSSPDPRTLFDANRPVVVFGGAGFIGTHLLAQLRTITEAPLVCIDIRDPVRPVAGVSYRRHDMRDLSGLDFDGTVPILFNLGAVHTTPGHLPWEYYDTNVRGAIEITRFAQRHQTKQIVFTSSISVYGPDETLKTEATPPMPISDYGRSKLIAEEIHRDWLARDGNHKLVIARPAVVFGLGEGGNFTRLAKLLEKGWFVFPGRRDTVKSCIYVGDLVQWMLTAAVQEDHYVLFNGAFPDRFTIEEIVDTFRKVAFPSARTITMPATVLKYLAALMRPLSAAGLGIHPDRIVKLMVSTNVRSDWIGLAGLEVQNQLERSLRNWMRDGNGRFL
jgi:nucleoside-diphosphate-sugar epimerase